MYRKTLYQNEEEKNLLKVYYIYILCFEKGKINISYIYKIYHSITILAEMANYGLCSCLMLGWLYSGKGHGEELIDGSLLVAVLPLLIVYLVDNLKFPNQQTCKVNDE